MNETQRKMWLWQVAKGNPKMFTPSVHITNFVRRQTPQSGYSHWTISDEDLLGRVLVGIANAKPGYREGVLIVPVDPVGFFSSTVLLKPGMRLVGEYVARQAGEEPRKSNYALDGEKTPAVRVDVILYAHAVLAEKSENETEADYEIVSVNASIDLEEPPIPTGALIANHFELSGGTASKMTNDEFVALLHKSVLYWRDKTQAVPEHLRN